jgi:hypothetical protein
MVRHPAAWVGYVYGNGSFLLVSRVLDGKADIMVQCKLNTRDYILRIFNSDGIDCPIALSAGSFW